MESGEFAENGAVLREQIRQLDRRLAESLADRRELWKEQGVIQQSNVRAHERLDAHEKNTERIEKSVESLKTALIWWFVGLTAVLVASTTIIALAVTR